MHWTVGNQSESNPIGCRLGFDRTPKNRSATTPNRKGELPRLRTHAAKQTNSPAARNRCRRKFLFSRIALNRRMSIDARDRISNHAYAVSYIEHGVANAKTSNYAQKFLQSCLQYRDDHPIATTLPQSVDA